MPTTTQDEMKFSESFFLDRLGDDFTTLLTDATTLVTELPR